MQARLALVREVEVAPAVERQVVDALEALAVAPFEIRTYRAGRDVTDHEAIAIVGDQKLPVVEKLHPVRLAVVLRDLRPGAGRVDPEDSTPGNVADIEPALVVEDRALEEGVDDRAAAVGPPPRALLLAAEVVGQTGKGLQFPNAGRFQ